MISYLEVVFIDARLDLLFYFMLITIATMRGLF